MSPSLGPAQQLQEQHYPFLQGCSIFVCVQIMVWLPVFGIFSACMHGDACNCTQGSADTVTESTLEVDPGEKFFAAPGTRTHVSIVPGFSVKLSTD